jgi:hypothetical protein
VLHEWAIQWGVPIAAVADLQRRMGLVDTEALPAAHGSSEAAVQARLRLDASVAGWRVFRNNVGVLRDDRGVPVRYGLANDTAALNAKLKSADLIGLRPVRILHAHVGSTIGQFVSLEAKEIGWRYTDTPHERSQAAWSNLINSLGGYARFTTGEL